MTLLPTQQYNIILCKKFFCKIFTNAIQMDVPYCIELHFPLKQKDILFIKKSYLTRIYLPIYVVTWSGQSMALKILLIHQNHLIDSLSLKLAWIHCLIRNRLMSIIPLGFSRQFDDALVISRKRMRVVRTWQRSAIRALALRRTVDPEEIVRRGHEFLNH